jgi:hypothetical protein
MDSSKLFRDVSMAEGSGFGVWYEYLAKYRIFRKHTGKKVLIFGLPEKYSLGLDTLFYSGVAELHVADIRKSALSQYSKYAKQFSKKIKIIQVKNLKQVKKNNYDLLISTEVLQNDTSLISTIKNLAKKSIIFVPNSQCYAHPRISHLNSLSLRKLKELGKNQKMVSIDSGYIDCPPWPAGACLPKSKGKAKKDSLPIRIVKEILDLSIPLLTKLDNFYPSPWKELNSHMVYAVFKNG